MKRLLLLLALLLLPTGALAQCNGVFGANTACGSIAGGIPGQVPLSSFQTAPAGTNGQTQYNNSGVFGGYTPSQDCTVVPSTGVVTCLRTNNVAFGPAATAASITNSLLATMNANTIKANATGGTTTPTDVAPALARSASLLNIDEYTGHGDSIYTILATDRTVGTTAALTASRVWTLPAANALNPGQTLLVADYFGGVTATNTIVVTRAGADTINGATTTVINVAFGSVYLRSDGVSKWSFAIPSSASPLIDLTKPPYSACTGSDDTAQIRLWMVASAAGGSTPGIAYVPPGTTCLFNFNTYTPSNFTLWGYGATFKMLAGGNANSPLCICDVSQNATGPLHVTIYGLTVDGNTANRTGPFSNGDFTVIAASDVNLIDTVAISCAGDCYNINGNSTIGLSRRVNLVRAYGSGAGAATRNIITFDGVVNARVHQCFLLGPNSRSPGAGIDIEPDDAAHTSTDITIDTCAIGSVGGNAISVNPASIAGSVVQSQAMNIFASGNNVTFAGNDYQQFSTAATKAGFRFINAHGTFGGTTPAVDALP